MSTPIRKRFLDRLKGQRESTNIEDRRTTKGVAPIGSAGYPVGDYEHGMEAPDLNKPVPRGAPTFDAQQQIMKTRADMARMGEYSPRKRLRGK